ncbi:hypothetical protein Btru_025715 [Bulinus truncatus]|nr:hypothetical protein Btru_025715 [Bulinus truncatus]
MFLQLFDSNAMSLMELLPTVKHFDLVTRYIMIPAITFIGFTGNVISITILYRDGLHKCSNILICALALVDNLYLAGITNLPAIVYLEESSFLSCRASHWAVVTLQVLFHMSVLFENVGKIVSMAVPPLIVVERFVAVFFPLRLTSVVTFRRVVIAVALLYPISLPAYIVYIPILHGVTICYGLGANITAASTIVISTTASGAFKIFNILSEIYATFCGPVSVSFVVAGCVLISVRVQIQQRRRRKMTGPTKVIPRKSVPTKRAARDEKTASKDVKTTKVLLSVCFVYSLTGSFNFLSDMVLTSSAVGTLNNYILHRCSIVSQAAESWIKLAVEEDHDRVLDVVKSQVEVKQNHMRLTLVL